MVAQPVVTAPVAAPQAPAAIVTVLAAAPVAEVVPAAATDVTQQ